MDLQHFLLQAVHQIWGGPQSAQQEPNKIHKEINGFINKSVSKVLTRSALRANSDETLPYAPDTLGKQESQSWQKTK